MTFINRKRELSKLLTNKSRLAVIFGRRRIGKTAIVLEYAKTHPDPGQVFYTQAIEGAQSLQISQVSEDIAPLLPDIPIQSWPDFFKLLARVKQKCIVILDEFPYLVKTQPSLPSMLQKWLDHSCPKELKLVLLGSSQTMMHDTFLKSNAPLYERAGEIIHVKPMGFNYFCQAMNLDAMNSKSYLIYSLIGGVPKYWEYIDPEKSIIKLAEMLYFEGGSRLEMEPERLLKDENIAGEQAKSILELVGRGVCRPSEIAGRMNIKQTSLSGPLQLLRDASLIDREIPFNESSRSTKRSLYKLNDHCLSFWYSCYSPHRTRWSRYSDELKQKIIHDHAALMFEKDYRALYRDAARYWESSLEFDCVRYAGENAKEIIISEVKFHHILAAERKQIQSSVTEKFHRSKLAESFHMTAEAIGFTEGIVSMLVQGDDNQD